MQRFWEQATVGTADGGLVVLLDGKPMHLPGGAVLLLSSRMLAEAIAAEWQAAGGGKGGTMSLTDMPITRLAGTAQLRIAPDPAPTVAALARYADSDLLCYRAAGPDALVTRQTREWQPWLDWAARTLDARLLVTAGVAPIAQPEPARHALHRAVALHDPYGLAALGVLAPALGSLVLGLAVAAGRLDPATAARTAMLDELFQAELWGEDAEAARRRDAIAAEIADAARFAGLAAQP